MRTAWLEDLAARRRFGMKPGLGRIARLDAALGSPSRRLGRVIHVAGTNGKGATAAILDAALAATGARVARYTSPHLVRINERFSLGGAPLGDDVLEAASAHVASVVADDPELAELTFFEALTAVAFVAFAEAAPDWTILETGLGGRLDATNVCQPDLSVITRIGLDHCDWLGDTVEKIAAEKAGIVKPGVPVVLGRNEPSVRAVIADVARRQGAPLVFAPEAADESEIPADFSLAGAFNRENAVTALAALKVLKVDAEGFSRVIWPGRFQRVQDVLIDGAHNPPAARALAAALAETPEIRAGRRFALVAGFCGDKDVTTVLATLAPCVSRGFAVRTSNPRSLAADDTAARMRAAGIAAEPAEDLSHALASARASGDPVLVAGSLFLAGEVLQFLGALPGATEPADPSCLLRPQISVLVNDSPETIELERALDEISPERRALALAYRSERDRRLSVAVYLLLKAALKKGYGLSENPRLACGPNGKPYLPDYPEIHFNLSHCAKAAACVVADRPVGIDVEAIAPIDWDVARRVLSAAELADVRAADEPEVAFARYWTKKEALVKLSGEGIDEKRLPSLLAQAHDCQFETTVNRARGYVLTTVVKFYY